MSRIISVFLSLVASISMLDLCSGKCVCVCVCVCVIYDYIDTYYTTTTTTTPITTGPEISCTKSNIESSKSMKYKCHSGMSYHLYKGTTIEFFRTGSNIQLLQCNTMIEGVNCGFGNWENPAAIR